MTEKSMAPGAPANSFSTINADVSVVFRDGSTIGESLLWAQDEGALYWVDIKAPTLYLYDLASDTRQKWPLSSDCGAFALIADESAALVALRDGLHRLDFASGALSLIAPAPFDPSLFRFNEGAVDASGRFWVGVMFDPEEKTSEKRKGALHSFTFADGLRHEADRAEIHNGMAWSSDARILYLSHSEEHRIDRIAFDPLSGIAGEREVFATIPEDLGVPDGAAVDVEGFYWCAVHGGSRIRRFAPDGTIDSDVMLPVSQPTMCAFGGNDLDTLYVTSATDGLSREELQRQPLAGALLSFKPGVRGLSKACFVR